jgi:(S)-2-hydroxyglutarate dehydrogenase
VPRKQIIVIGGGIVGLSTARELLSCYPFHEVTLLEKEAQIATHQTGHNSGVIHSGIYYPPGSLKAKLCREGVGLLEKFCLENEIEIQRCGKLILATREEELSFIDRLFAWGQVNGVPDLKILTKEQLHELEPTVSGLKALHLPQVALVDFKKVSTVLKAKFEKCGGKIFIHQKVVSIKETGGSFEVKSDAGEYQADMLINCAGLYSDEVARIASVESPVQIIPFRGEYFKLAPRLAKRVNRLIYPVPNPAFPFLGIHFTPTLSGDVTVGPNAVLAFAREGYLRHNVHFGELFKLLTYEGFWKMSARYWRMGLIEMSRSLSKRLYVRAGQALLPELSTKDLLPWGSGVRAQAVDRSGALVNDFLYVRKKNAIHVLNAPSPAATSALAIAKQVVRLLPY